VALDCADFKAFIKDAFDYLTCVALRNGMGLDQAEGAVGELGCETPVAHFIREEEVALSLHHRLVCADVHCIGGTL